MSGPRTIGGKVLVVGGKVVTNPDCCCGCPPITSTECESWVASKSKCGFSDGVGSELWRTVNQCDSGVMREYTIAPVEGCPEGAVEWSGEYPYSVDECDYCVQDTPTFECCGFFENGGLFYTTRKFIKDCPEYEPPFHAELTDVFTFVDDICSVERSYSPSGAVYDGSSCPAAAPEFSNEVEPPPSIEFSNEYLTEELISEAEAELAALESANGADCTAFRDLSGDETSFTIQKMRYRFAFAPPASGSYRIEWVERFSPEVGSPSDTPMVFDWDEMTTGAQFTPWYDVAVPGTDGETGIYDVETSCPTE